MRNKLTRDIRMAKMSYEEKLAEKIKMEPQSFYAYVRSKSQTKTIVGPLTNAAGVLSADNEEIAKLLNDAFSSMFTQEYLSNLPAPRNHHKVVDGLMLSDMAMSEKLVREATQHGNV